MPQIPQYTAKTDHLTQSDRGTEARTMAGRRAGQFYNQAAGEIEGAARSQASAAQDVAVAAGSAVRDATQAAERVETYQTHRIVSQGAPAAAQIYDGLDKELNTRASDVAKNNPNDPSWVGKFREEVVEPSLTKFVEAYSGTPAAREWAEARANRMREHFWQKSSAEEMNVAGHAVQTNIRQLGNSYSNTAFRSPDFHTQDEIQKTYREDVANTVGTSRVKGGDAARVFNEISEKGLEQIAKAGAAGAIAKSANPEATAQTWADRYPQYINGADAKALAKAAKVQSKTNFLQDKQIETYQRQQEDRAVHAESAKLMNDYVSTDPQSGRPIIKPGYYQAALDIARKYPDAPSAAAQVHAQITWGEHQQDRKAMTTVSDPLVKSTLYTRLFDPNNPTTEVELMKANVEGKLSTHDFTALHQLQKSLDETPLKGEVMKDTMAAVKANLTYSMPGLPGRDPKGLAAYSAFVQKFVPEYIKLSRAGTLPSNALDTRDPNSLISQSMAPFKRSAKQLITDRVEELSTLADNNNLTAPGRVDGPVQVIEIPAGMSPAEAVKKYGKGTTVRRPDGSTKVLQ